ncbi:MAG: hypothetical protein IT514_01560 [Burkholderiales bacterium]|nr:hypothetical protein [Burkholderiales bacterium]
MDPVFTSWLARQHADAEALSAASDAVRLVPEPGPRPARRFIAEFKAPTMVRRGTQVVRAHGFAVLVQFPDDYLRAASDVARIVNLLAPENVFHPNVRWPFICMGRLAPGMGLSELLYQAYEILTFQKLTPREDDALNADACVWARSHMDLFPLSRAPLRRRAAVFSVHEISCTEDSRESRGT